MSRLPVTLFYSYAHVDEPLQQQMEKHLSLLQRQGLILPWHDRAILPGDEWAKDIDEHLNTASIILLLISPDFLASDYCYDKEMQRAVERHTHGEAHVIPILLRPCDWHSAPFGKLQAVPRDGKAVSEWDNQDKAFLAVATELRRVIERFTGPQLAPVDEWNRTILIKRVRQIWIEGLLEQSLHKAAWIELNLQAQPEAVENPWRLLVQELDQTPRPLAPGTPLVQVYDEANGQMLLLGDPGAGKTTLLLELTRTLLERAERDTHLPLPVVFTLSTWADQRLPLSDWILEELKTRYQVPHKIGMTLLTTNRIIPLLDGLDEVAEDMRAACVQAIIVYSQEHLDKGPTPLVVCCRSKEYADLSTLVPLQQAVSILPLSQGQIDQYLQSVGEQVAALRQALQDDAQLNALARQPLMLSIFTLAYQGLSFADLQLENSQEATLQLAFAHYVKRMLHRRGHLKQWKPEQVQRFLTFLARQMHQQNMTSFSVEEIQLVWLPANRRRLYQLVIRLMMGLVMGLVIGLFVGFGNGLISGITAGLVGGLFVGLVRRPYGMIKPVEILSWSLKSEYLRKWLVVGLYFGLVSGLVIVLFFGIVRGLAIGLFLGLFFGLFEGLVKGFSGTQLDERTTRAPNEGIRRSMKNGLFVGVIVGLGGGLVNGLFIGVVSIPGGGLSGGLVTALLIGLSVGLFFGLGSALKHYILRFWLWRLGYLPWNLVPFLDEATKRLLLRKVGGSYIYVHRQLLDYFASLEHTDM